MLIALGAVLVVSLLLAANALNFGLPLFNDEPGAVRTKNKSLDKDAEKADDKKVDDSKPSSPSNSQGVQKNFNLPLGGRQQVRAYRSG